MSRIIEKLDRVRPVLMSRKKVIVTGGAGYIGSHIVLELNRLGYQVLIVDDMSKGNRKNLFPENEFI